MESTVTGLVGRYCHIQRLAWANLVPTTAMVAQYGIIQNSALAKRQLKWSSKKTSILLIPNFETHLSWFAMFFFLFFFITVPCKSTLRPEIEPGKNEKIDWDFHRSFIAKIAHTFFCQILFNQKKVLWKALLKNFGPFNSKIPNAIVLHLLANFFLSTPIRLLLIFSLKAQMLSFFNYMQIFFCKTQFISIVDSFPQNPNHETY